MLKVGLAEPVERTLAALRAEQARRPPGSAFVLLYRWDLFSAPRQDVLDEIMSSISSGGMPVEKKWEKSTYHIVRFRGS